MCAVRPGGEVVACVEDVEGREPIGRGRGGFTVQGEGRVLGYDVTEEE